MNTSIAFAGVIILVAGCNRERQDMPPETPSLGQSQPARSKEDEQILTLSRTHSSTTPKITVTFTRELYRVDDNKYVPILKNGEVRNTLVLVVSVVINPTSKSIARSDDYATLYVLTDNGDLRRGDTIRLYFDEHADPRQALELSRRFTLSLTKDNAFAFLSAPQKSERAHE